MAISVVGSLSTISGGNPLSVTTNEVGNALVLTAYVAATNPIVSVTSSHATWSRIGGPYAASGVNDIWLGVVTSVATANVTITTQATLSGFWEFDVREFTSDAAAVTWLPDGFGGITNASSTVLTFPTLTPTGPGELYYGHGVAATTGGAGSTSGFTYDLDAAGNVACYNPNVSGAVSPTGTVTAAGTSFAVAALIEENTSARQPVALTHIGSTTWVAPASAAAVAPTYPSGLADATTTQTDIIYAFLHIKPDTATVDTPTGWTLVSSAAGGSGTQGVGTGATRVHVYKRTATAALSGGTQSFTITGGSSPEGMMRAYRATGTNVAFVGETLTSWSVTTGSTTIGGTAAASLDLAAQDEIACILGTADDAASTLTLTGLTATGATLGALTQDPAATVINAQGNDTSATAYRIPVTAGASTSAPVATATSNSAETAMGLLLRIRATADVPAAPPDVFVRPGLAAIQASVW